MNELNYVSLEASKRLIDAGIMLETDTVWVEGKKGWFLIGISSKADYFEDDAFIPAPSMAEVWRELPNFIDKGNHRYRKTIYSDGWVTCVWFESYVESRFKSTNPTDALIALLIWVKKEKR